MSLLIQIFVVRSGLARYQIYDEVNVTDYYHNTIILTVETDNIDNVRDVIMETFGVLYKS